MNKKSIQRFENHSISDSTQVAFESILIWNNRESFHRRFEQSNATHLTASEESRHLRDPYEDQYVEVRKSSLLKANRDMLLR